MLDSFYHRMLRSLKITFLHESVMLLPSFTQRFNGCHYVIFTFSKQAFNDA